MKHGLLMSENVEARNGIIVVKEAKDKVWQALPERPLVSIIVPSYNQGAFIRQTIDSCLEQDYRPIEIIVMDGASTDETVEVLKSYGEIPELKWVSEPDEGVQDAVNKGVAKAEGILCGIQSSDDAYMPQAVSAAVAHFQRQPEMALIYGDAVKIDEQGEEISRWRTGSFSITNFLSKKTHVQQSAAFFRRDAFLQIGGWSSDYFIADTECWLRMILEYPALKVDEWWGRQRRHEAQRDHQSMKINDSFVQMLQQNTMIQEGSWRWRRAARCGMIRHRLRYGETPSSEDIRKAYWLAIRAWPPVVMDREVLSTICPIYLGVERRWRQLKQGKGGASGTTEGAGL